MAHRISLLLLPFPSPFLWVFLFFFVPLSFSLSPSLSSLLLQAGIQETQSLSLSSLAALFSLYHLRTSPPPLSPNLSDECLQTFLSPSPSPSSPTSCPSSPPPCMTPEQLFAMHSFPLNATLSEADFLRLFPSLLAQLPDPACHQPFSLAAKEEGEEGEEGIDPEIWRNTFITVACVSMLAVLGPALIPCLGRSWTSILIDTLISIGAGVLLGDAFLHLIPSALGVLEHGPEPNTTLPKTPLVFHPADAGEEENPLQPVWLCLTVVMVIYLLFLLEKSLLGSFGLGHGDSGDHGHAHSHQPMRDPVRAGNKEASRSHSHHPHSEPSDPAINSSSSTEIDPLLSEPSTASLQDEGRKSEKIKRSAGWFVFFADFVHNFVDGVAIGSSFAVSTSTGISTTIAIVLHEIPHEIADFAILLQAGFPKLTVIAMCVVVQLTAFLGAVMGVYLGNDPGIVNYIIAGTAGMFIYVALVDLFPHLEFSAGSDSRRKMIGNNFGLVLGIAFMLAISLFEEYFEF